MKALLSSLNMGQIIETLNHTFIAQVSKKKHPSIVLDYRPISLYNVLYKLISKVVANRLKVLLPYLILDSQSDFVLGRQIMDKILIAYEVIHFLRRKSNGTQCFMSLKLDISKAYNRVE